MTVDRMIWATCGIVSVLALQAAMHAHNATVETAAIQPAGFTDSKGLDASTRRAWADCMKHVFIQGHRVKANHPSAEPGTPTEIFQRCMLAKDATI